jgi:kynureninase
MEKLRIKSIQLTQYLEKLIKSELSTKVTIFTPSNIHERGCQLSLSFNTLTGSIEEVVEKLKLQGVICDARKPNVIRIAPTPLYNTFSDIYKFVLILKSIL